MKSHVVLLGRVLEDSSIRCCVSTTNDMKTVISRVEDEGVSFLTITLPSFATDFEIGLDRGSVDSTLFHSFRKRACLPAFLQGFTSRVFCKETGVLLLDPCIDSIQAIRQICNLFKKLEVPCSEERERAAFASFMQTESDVLFGMMNRKRSDSERFQVMASKLFWRLFTKLDRKILDGEIVPAHGPGTTQDKTLGNAKYQNRVWTERLEEYFPAGEFLFTNQMHYINAYDDVVWLTPEQEPPVRVVSVPKTLKTPRIIAIEPVHQQYVQQGIREYLYDEIERDRLLRHFIGFTDQEPNRTMACQGSRDLSMATLDLSEASDRVSIQHVVDLFHSNTVSRGAVMACRSTKAEVPGYGVTPLAKYASMGSALTFPIEAMVFLTVVFLGIERELNTRMTDKFIRNELIGKVRVYGDDIIIPVEYTRSVVEELERFNLKVNSSKSFWTGKFRESCGGDYYDGVDVSYVKAKAVLPSHRKHVVEISKTVPFRNQMYMSGYWRTAAFLDNLLSGLVPFPTIHPESPGLGRVTFLDYEVQRICPNLQRPLVKALVDVSRIPTSVLEGEDALLKYFLKRGDKPFADKRHLERAGRPVAVDIKLRWVTPY